MKPAISRNSDKHDQRSGVIAWAEAGLLPDRVIRAGIQRLNRQRLEEIQAHDIELSSAHLADFVESMKSADIAPRPELANEQHYEVPAAFFAEVLGINRKYSCCYWDDEVDSLDRAEEKALQVTCHRAGIEDGMRVLDLGCGWGSLSLYIARQFPNCKVTAVSNSRSQWDHVTTQAALQGFENVHCITRDMNVFETSERFDRIVSIEMFEHMRNYEKLFARVARWLKDDGRFFMHIFCHRLCAYEFVDSGPNDWMSRHFFSGGMMPSDDLPLRFQTDLKILSQWRWNGSHYEKTANAWLENMDSRRSRIMPLLAKTYGPDHAKTWYMRWRMFFMACAELFGHDLGREWYVGHYLFGRAEEAAEKPCR